MSSNYDEMTRASIAKAFGVTPGLINAWLKAGCPQQPSKKYSLPDVIQWRIDQAKAVALQGADEGQKWLSQLRKEKAKIAGFDRQVKEGQLVPRDAVAKAAAMAAQTVKQALSTMPPRLAPSLAAARSESEAQTILENEICKTLELIADALTA